MSNLDEALEFVAHTDIEWEGETPREEVKRLRAAASEADALRNRLSIEKHCAETLSAARDLLAAEVKQLRATVAEQARQIETARELEQHVRNLHDYEIEMTACAVCHFRPAECECGYTPIRAWLAANAPTPAPEAEQERTIVDAFADGM